ncbi:bifunctional metallophosphatase/5'-nucleotidase [Halorientalis salina]|uniref:bifunctional metallophosphatase/5'-nucleotidase n=1 Tax=Halorientalis salina TaxID=2932266 RepID=UPI0010AB9644|nr:bifunctional metallophosphatase/5'-nucleotidase [Halorientalis salina]
MSVRLLHYSDLENGYDDPNRVGRLAGLIAARRTPETVVVGTGDNTAPGVLSMVSEGRQALDFFSAVEPVADTFGNHDFDYGPDAIRDIVAESPQTWVSANVELDGDTFGADVGVVPSTVVDADGTSLGLVGVTEPETASMCPGASDLTFTDPVAAVSDEADALRRRGVDAVVVLSHLGSGDDELARRTDVDAVLGGHVHSKRIDRVDGTILTRPGANGHTLLEIDLGSGTVDAHAVADGPKDEAVEASLVARRDDAGLEEVVGHVATPLVRDREQKGRGECRIGNFIADAYRWAADADAGLQNSGGIREGAALSGAVTVADLVSVVPFDEPVTVTELTGAELRTLCEQADGWRFSALPDRWHAHVSGLAIRQDGDGRITATVDGQPIEDEETYTLATSEYLLYTDHEFPVLDEHHRVDRLDTQYEVIAEYARERGIDPEIEGRIRRVAAESPERPVGESVD